MVLVKNKYTSFYNCIIKKYCSIPVKNSNYVPQGICTINNNIIISCYDHSRINNSILFVCHNNNIKTIYLDTKAHGGGIAYHEKTDSLYVTGEGHGKKSFINKYCGKDLLKAKDLSTITVEKTFCVDEDNSLYSSYAKHSSCAYLTIYKNELYVGNFIDSNSMCKYKSIIKKFKILNSGNISKYNDIFYNPFSNTQGLCILNYNNKKYYIFSRSFGRKRNSLLNICLQDGNKFKCLNSIVFPSMLEQVNTYKDNIICVFESCADCYSYNCITYNNEIYLFNFKKLLDCNDDKICFSKGKKLFVSNKSIDIKGIYGQN